MGGGPQGGQACQQGQGGPSMQRDGNSRMPPPRSTNSRGQGRLGRAVNARRTATIPAGDEQPPQRPPRDPSAQDDGPPPPDRQAFQSRLRMDGPPQGMGRDFAFGVPPPRPGMGPPSPPPRDRRPEWDAPLSETMPPAAKPTASKSD